MCWVRFTRWTQQPCRAAELHSVSQHCGSLWGVLAWRTRGCISRVKGGNLTWFAPPLLSLRTERDEREDEGGEDGQRGRRGLMRSGSVFREDVYRSIGLLAVGGESCTLSWSWLWIKTSTRSRSSLYALLLLTALHARDIHQPLTDIDSTTFHYKLI